MKEYDEAACEKLIDIIINLRRLPTQWRPINNYPKYYSLNVSVRLQLLADDCAEFMKYKNIKKKKLKAVILGNLNKNKVIISDKIKEKYLIREQKFIGHMTLGELEYYKKLIGEWMKLEENDAYIDSTLETAAMANLEEPKKLIQIEGTSYLITSKTVKDELYNIKEALIFFHECMKPQWIEIPNTTKLERVLKVSDVISAITREAFALTSMWSDRAIAKNQITGQWAFEKVSRSMGREEDCAGDIAEITSITNSMIQSGYITKDTPNALLKIQQSLDIPIDPLIIQEMIGIPKENGTVVVLYDHQLINDEQHLTITINTQPYKIPLMSTGNASLPIAQENLTSLVNVKEIGTGDHMSRYNRGIRVKSLTVDDEISVKHIGRNGLESNLVTHIIS